jgi:hypothetical protein
MNYAGSCHCGRVAFEVQGELDEAIECNCSHCSRKGYLLWFVPREQLTFRSGESELSTYLFNKQAIRHHFCPNCGCAPLELGSAPSGQVVASVNVRCLEGVDLASVKRVPVEGRSL